MDAGEEVVAFLGPKASYTHQAAKKLFPSKKEAHITPQTTIEDVFAAVQAGTATHGVVPFENSSNGSVIFTLDLFANTAGHYPDIIVEREIYLPVHHCLLGHIGPPAAANNSSSSSLQATATTANAQTTTLNPIPESPIPSGQVTPTQNLPSPQRPRTKPAHPLPHIRKLYSHPQAWGQCKIFLSTYLKHAERQDVSSTSKAAELVAQDGSGASAAVSSRLAAELNGLDVLAEGIEDSEGNSTRFFVLRRRGGSLRSGDHTDGDGGGDGDAPTHTNAVSPPTAAAEEEKQENDEAETQKFKSLVTFTVDHASPGALADSLAVFKKYHLNLTSINTRPSGVMPWQYIFFVEFTGRKRGDGEGGAVNLALGDLGRVASSWRWLGSWESMRPE